MSQDFLLAMCPDQSKLFASIEDAKKAMHQRFTMFYKAGLINGDDLDNLCYDDHGYTDDATYFAKLINALDESLEYLWDCPNDMACLTDSADYPLWISGGISYGDSPTEAFDNIVKISIAVEWPEVPKLNKTETGKQVTV